MALTLQELRGHIGHTIDGGMSASLPGGSTTGAATRVVNEAGRYLTTVRRWRFMQRPPATLNFVADQEYVDLPNDFAHLLNIVANGLTVYYEHSTYEQILKMRAQDVTPQGIVYWGAIVQPPNADSQTALPPPRIELHPAPPSNQQGALTVVYRAKWRDLSDNDDVANIPEYAEMLLIQYIRAFAQAYENDHYRNLAPLLEEVESSGIFRNTLDYDNAVQEQYGRIENGQVASMRSAQFDWFDDPKVTI